MSYTNADEDTVRDIQDDWQDVEFRPSPTASTSPDVADDIDGKASRKREREISLEPATPKEAESVFITNAEERRTPATKKNRLQLDSTVEEEETPPSSPNKSPISLSTSPPHESKVRHIREKVRVLSWEEREKQPNNLDGEDEMDGYKATDLEARSADNKNPPLHLSESDSDDQDKNLKRKLGDRSVSGGLNVIHASSSQEPIKRARDDAEEDVNPREKKRPTPPPEELEPVEDRANASSLPDSTIPEISQNKPNGFLSYASAKSPFAHTAGPSLFGRKQSPFLSPNHELNDAGTSTSISLTATSSAEAGPSTFHGAPALGIKRTGFEAFASVSSPFTVSRPKSPVGSVLRPHASGKLDRSKSPPRRPLGNANAFSSYAGPTSPFVIPPVKKQKQEQESGNETDVGENEYTTGNRRASLNEESVETGEDDGDRQRSFSERLRASKQDNGIINGEEGEAIITITEQERQTGEEHDDTLFQVRAKLYALSDQKQWKERGTGLLKLNVRKSDGGGARLLMRKEAVFNLLLNAPLFKGMRCNLAQDPRFVRFSVIEGGLTVHYNLRLANAKVAGELLEEINANIPGEEERDSSESV